MRKESDGENTDTPRVDVREREHQKERQPGHTSRYTPIRADLSQQPTEHTQRVLKTQIGAISAPREASGLQEPTTFIEKGCRRYY